MFSSEMHRLFAAWEAAALMKRPSKSQPTKNKTKKTPLHFGYFNDSHLPILQVITETSKNAK